MLRAEDPLVRRQQRGELVPGPGRVARLPGPAGEVGRERSGCVGSPRRGPALAPAAARRTGPGPRLRPPPPRSSRRGWRGRAGCAGAPRRGPAPAPAAARRTGPGPRLRLPPPRSSRRDWRGRAGCAGVSAPRTRSCDRQQRGELVPGPGCVPRLPGPAGKVGARVQGVRVLRAEDPLLRRQQRGELVPGPGYVPRLPGPVGEVGAGVQGVRVSPRRGPAHPPAAARRTGPGPRLRLPPPRSSGQDWRARSGCRGCSVPRTCSSSRQLRGELVPGPGCVSRLPGPRARPPRAVRVRGCSGPRTRSSTASSVAYCSRAPATSPASPVQRARSARAVRVLGCSAPSRCSRALRTCS